MLAVFRHTKALSYLLAVVLSTVLAWLTCENIPAEYASLIEVSDEHKASLEIELGHNGFFGLIKDKDYLDEGLRDPYIYSTYLKSNDFIDSLAHTPLTIKGGITYGEYLVKCHREPVVIELLEDERNTEWVRETIKSHLRFKVVRDYNILKLQAKDNDPDVAKYIADRSIDILEAWLHDYFLAKYKQKFRAARRNYEESKLKYEELYLKYIKLADENVDVQEPSVHSEIESVGKELQLTYSHMHSNYEKLKRYEFISQQPEQLFAELSPSFSATEKCQPVLMAYIIAYIIVGIILTAFIRGYLRRRKSNIKGDFGDLSSPWNVTMGIWLIVLIATFSVGDMLYPIGEQFWIGFACWLPILVATSFVTYHLLTPQNAVNPVRGGGIDINTKLFYFFLCLTLVMTPLHLYKMWTQIAMLDTIHMLSNIRTLAVEGDRGTYGVLNYASWINKALFVIALWRYPKVSKWIVLLVVVLNLMSSFASMEKSGIFMMVIFTLFVLFVKKVIKVRTIVYVMLVLVGLLYLVNVSLQSSADEDAEYELFEFIAAYILTPPVAFCYLEPEFEGQFGMHTLPHVYRIVNMFGFDFKVISLVGEFVNVPVSTNVYTILDPFFVDFGYKGIAFFALLYGVMLGWAYSLFRKGSPFGYCIYTFTMFFLIMQYYMEEFFVGLYLNLFLIAVMFCITQTKYKIRV